ncbi:MAG TPA: AI-2E family transporter, partial [Gemmatimonadaceae bacterium]|nr:AI-2E family transporter [Gemmatimonadaceae bacterium]
MTKPPSPDHGSSPTAGLSTELSTERSPALAAEHDSERRSGQERRSRWRPSHGWRSRDILRAAALVLAFYWVAQLVWFANPLILAGFLGVLFGLAVTAGVDRLQRLRIPRGLGAFIIVFGFLGLLGAFFAWSGPTLAEQSRELRNRLPEAIDRIETWVETNRDSPLAGLILGSSAAGRPTTGGAAAGQGGDSVPTGAAAPSEAVKAQQQAADRLGADTTAGATAPGVSASSQLEARLAEVMRGATRYLFPFLSSTFAVAAGILLVIFLAIYVAVEPKT